MTRPRTLPALMLSAAMISGAAATAQAATTAPVWNCRASAAHVTISSNNRAEPIVANGNPNTADASADHALCARGQSGAGNLLTPLAIPTTFMSASTAWAVTDITPEIGITADQKPSAFARIERVELPLNTPNVVLGVAAAEAEAKASCVDGVPRLEGSSQLTGVTLGGQEVSLDELAEAIAEGLNGLDPIVDVRVNEQVREGDSLTQRALRVRILSSAGAVPLVDVVIAEARVTGPADVCKRVSGITGSGGQIVAANVKPCPKGAVYEAANNLCVITKTSENERIVVGRPFEGPSGGTVVALSIARKRYTSPCLHGGGSLYAIVGTESRDKITGTNKTDRILARGGRDEVSGGRGDDCIDGGTGSDSLSGTLGRDRIYGRSGNDHLNGGPGNDYLSAGDGNDTINAAYGADLAIGGAGRDFINVATAGRRARVRCGSGRDKVRFNHDEHRRISRDCEVRYLFRDRPRK